MKFNNKRRKQTKEVNTPKTKASGQSSAARRAFKADAQLLEKLTAIRDFNAHALFASLGRLLEKPFAFSMTIIVLAIAISLVSGFYLVRVNLQQFAGHLQNSTQMSLFLKDHITQAQAEKLATSLRDRPHILHVNVISKEQGMAEFKKYSGFGDALNVLNANPLPIVIEVMPDRSLDNKLQLAALLGEFKAFPEVELAEMDFAWLERLESIVAVGATAADLLDVLLVLAVLFITANTIRLELHNRREEVIVAKLVGATDLFIQIPFLYAGFWIGLISGVAAWFVVTIMMMFLRPRVETLSALYGGEFHLLFFTVAETLQMFAIATVLGILGAWLVLQYQLQHTKPE